VAPSFANENFPSPLFFHSLFLPCFRDELKENVLEWCLEDDNVTHKYFAEMGRLARDETPFLSVVQSRATTLSWWTNYGNVIPLDTHDHDKSTRSEISYPSTNPLIILSFYFCESPFSYK
jgi:hypothetical protein